MGLGVENDSTFIGLLNQNFDDIEFYNASLIGYSSNDYLNVTKSLIDQRKNDLMISDIFIFWCLNDIYSNFPDPDSPEYKGDFIKTITSLLGRNSKLYHFLKTTFSDRSKAYFEYDRQFYSADNEQLKKSIQNLKQLRQITDTSNVSIKIFLLPYEYQIRNADKSNIFEPQILFKSLMSDSNLDVIDCSEVFRQYDTPSRDFYLYGDGIHFSKLGHNIIARYLIKLIQ
jgi:lysophospholipase L1-like esterase